MSKRRLVFTSLLVTICVVIAGFALYFTLPAQGGVHEVELQGVDGDDIAGWARMLKPDGRAASLSAETAVTAASAKKPGAKAMEVVLMRLVNGSQQPPLDKLAWAVNFDPSTVQGVPPIGPAGAKFPRVCDLHPQYDVVWIDAQTGEFIFETQYTAAIPEGDPGATCPPKDYPSPTQVPGQ